MDLIKLIIVCISILVKYRNRKLVTKNGPNGTKFWCFFHNISIDIGKARKLAINITIIPKNGFNTSPITNINLISPPPKVSFLNKAFPNIIIPYIKANSIIPDNKWNNEEITPLNIVFIIKKYPVKNINTSSGITKYDMSDTDKIVSNEIIPKAKSKPLEKPKV